MDERIVRVPIPKPEGHGCFACGTANPIGLNLQFYRCGEKVCTDITLDRRYEGWENMVHGGILSTILDEVMSWTIIVFKRVFFVTRRMEVKYIKPVMIGAPLTVSGWLVDSSRPPKIRVEAEVADHEGAVLTRAKGEFVQLPEERLSMVPEGLKEDMNFLFERLPSF
ncbi:MAG: PaaI family thioesterase [Deltaproteobacteria bacterium]|nr:PaaI family thioesterase [Deltaproteobacteria bacterium]